MKKILLAGSTASGKTTLAKMLAFLGAGFIEVEEIFFRYFEETTEGKNRLMAVAPDCYLETGLVDREKLLGYLSPQIVADLRSSLTPFVFTCIDDYIQQQTSCTYIIIISHAGPSGLKQQLLKRFDMPVYLVDSTRECRVERLKTRNQAVEEQIQALIVQDEVWLYGWEENAHIIFNHACLQTLFKTAIHLHQTILDSV